MAENRRSEPGQALDGSSGPSRRSLLNLFLGSSLGALAVAVLYPVLRYLTPPRTTEAAGQQTEVGLTNDPSFVAKGYTITRLGGEPVIVVRAGEEDFRAFAATCTHLACIVEYHEDQKILYCNCHGGQFNLSGQVVGGPPPRPLATYQVNLVPVQGTAARKVVVSRS
jgi:cytochrome b6-f complex iron-sulfur subunit